MPSEPGSTPAFCFDIGSPYAYLAAERVESLIDGGVDWCPVLLGAVFKATGRSSWAQTPARADGIAELQRRVAQRGLPALRWPEPWPNNGLTAMRVAVAACGAGRGREYALEAMRLQFRDGVALDDREAVALAAQRAGLDRDDALRRAGEDEVKAELRLRTDEALALGVIGVPTLVVGDGRVFWGDDRLEDAAAHVNGAA
jgi:2-hydroxychromene-2-carboxylate isomerase